MYGLSIKGLSIANHLESELLEEVRRSSGLLLAGDLLLVQVSVLEDLLQILLHLNLFVSNKISLIDSLLQVHVDLVPRGEDVTHVNVLYEGLHGLGAFLDLLLRHATGDLTGATGDSSDEAMGEALVIRVAVFHGFDDNSLLSGVAASKDDNNFSGFDDGHLVYFIFCVRTEKREKDYHRFWVRYI